MKEMLLFVALGASLVGIFVFLLWGSGAQNEQDESIPASDSEQPSLPAELLIERIFGADDWSFLSNHAGHDAQRQFLNERKEIAFFWLALMRARARTAMNIHRMQARGLRDVESLLEFRIAA